jgi:hypothetical protein
MYFRARYYDPQTGEFVSRDPLEYVDGMSQYRGYFVPGKIDPRGLGSRSDIPKRMQFSCNCGWIDWEHVRYGRITDIWQQIRDETGQRSEDFPGFQVVGNAGVDGLWALGDQKLEFYVSYDMDLLLKHEVFFEIMKLTMEAHEAIQDRYEDIAILLGIKSHPSGWSEEDLSSYLLGGYRAIGSTNEDHIKLVCEVIEDRETNLKIYDSLYPDDQMPQHRDWPPNTPLHSDNAVVSSDCACGKKKRKWPDQFNAYRGVRQGNDTWRRWIYGKNPMDFSGRKVDETLEWEGVH